MDFYELTLRLVLSFMMLLIITRIMGRKELSQITFHNFVSAVAIGNIGASLAIDDRLDVLSGIYALIGWTVFTVALGYIDIKSKRAMKWFNGDALIVIKEGKIMEGALRKARLDLDSLNLMLRRKSVFSIKDVDYAIFETDGTLSVMKKDNKQSVTKEDLGFSKSSSVIPIGTEVISDGKINEHNLLKLNLSPLWLEQQLRKAGVKDPSDIFYAEVQKDGSLYIDLKNDEIN
ncbi:DUF421 domain-containing protein [Alkalihalobacillus berkeleyi]|uniref:DUF421 domain-containing protein n=2 Tax=Pseudalkalibacillus berkeleyi TaxID=1069813 RepID=A0ABS9H516_9BACL|nr:DUF421 domain-containing protein [Pseudalkalibacillus berkeleyi]